MVRYLVEEAGAPVGQRTGGGGGRTARELAEEKGHARIVAYLQGFEKIG